MKRYLKDTLTFAALAFFSYVLWMLFAGISAIDIQLHDITLDWTSRIFLILGLTTFYFFLARSLTRRFSTVRTNVGLIVGLVALLLILFRFFQMLRMISGSTAIIMVEALFMLLTLCMVLLIVRTYRQWRREYGR